HQSAASPCVDYDIKTFTAQASRFATRTRESLQFSRTWRAQIHRFKSLKMDKRAGISSSSKTRWRQLGALSPEIPTSRKASMSERDSGSRFWKWRRASSSTLEPARRYRSPVPFVRETSATILQTLPKWERRLVSLRGSAFARD